MVEKWIKITSTQNRYEVSNFGRIRSFYNTKGNLRNEPKILKPWQTGRKYKNGLRGSLSLKLTTDNGLKRFKVHHLVLEAFIGKAPRGYEAAHLDGNILNNKIDNLMWVTHIENERHKLKHNTLLRGENHCRSKITKQDVIKIRNLYNIGYSQSEISKLFPITRRYVGRIVNKECWKHVE